MHSFLTQFYHWCSHTWIGTTLAKSAWAFAAIETVHIVGLTVLLGSALVLHLSILGVGLKKPAELAKDVMPYLFGGLAIMLTTGIPMFMSSPTYYAPNPAFRIKCPCCYSPLSWKLRSSRPRLCTRRRYWGR